MIIVVTGGRTYHDGAFVYATLDQIHAAMPIILLVQGGGTGADRLAETWAMSRGVKWKREQADWRRYGDRMAGRIRNQKMLDVYKPNMVVAFPGGNGTADMVKRAKALAYAEDCHEIAPRTYLIKLSFNQATQQAS